jgi:AraC-like DNA-binding protein
MSSPLTSYVPLGAPRLRVLEDSALPLRVEPLTLLTPLEGQLVVRRAGETFRLRTGELLVLRHGDSLEIDRAGARSRFALFRAFPEWVDAFSALHGLPEPAGPASELLPAGSALARRAGQLLSEPTPVSSEVSMRPSTVAALLEIAFQAQGSPLASRRSRRQATAQRETLIRGLEDYDPEEGVRSLDGLAERLGLSPRQTARLVRGETGRSFRELKAAAQLERARKLLASSELSILEVALRAGWNSTSQFHAAFRRNVGVTPARYRAANRG